MKRTLLIASLSLVASTAAVAQSSVTVWGRLNVSAERQKLEGVTNKGLENNSSRLGFRGVEDLGGGLKAGFAIEHGFDPTSGTTSGDRFWGRGSEVFLSSNAAGTLRLGNFTSEAYYATADYISLHNHDTGSSADALYAYIGPGVLDNNKVAYRTPEFAGFTAEVAVSEAQGGFTDRGYDAALNYNAGPLSLGAGYQKVGDVNQFALRGLYTAGAFTFGAYFQRDEDVFGADFGTRNSGRVSGMYTFGASELHLNFGLARDYSEVEDSGAKQATIAYGYNLSKRTRAYAFYTKLSADAASPFADFSSVAVGLRHNF